MNKIKLPKPDSPQIFHVSGNSDSTLLITQVKNLGVILDFSPSLIPTSNPPEYPVSSIKIGEKRIQPLSPTPLLLLCPKPAPLLEPSVQAVASQLPHYLLQSQNTSHSRSFTPPPASGFWANVTLTASSFLTNVLKALVLPAHSVLLTLFYHRPYHSSQYEMLSTCLFVYCLFLLNRCKLLGGRHLLYTQYPEESLKYKTNSINSENS